jgi:hypothetical protein
MSTITGSYSTEDKILKKLSQDYSILAVKVLVSSYPILALAEDDANFILLEYLKGENFDYLQEHLKWFYTHRNELRNRFHISSVQKEKIIFIITSPQLFKLELPGLNSEVEFLFYNQGRFNIYHNYVINLSIWDEFLHRINNQKLRKKTQRVLGNIVNSYPLICKNRGSNYIQILAGDEVHNLYLVNTKVFYHKGPAPFSPRIISI